ISGAGGLTKTGTGNQTLSGTNTFTGDTLISDGTLTLQNGAALADAAAVTVNTPGVLQVDNAETIGSLAGTGGVTLNDTLTTGGNDTNTTFSGGISGSGGLTKDGTGTFTLSGTNTYSGLTQVNSGWLLASNGDALGAGDGTAATGTVVASGATLRLSDGVTISNEHLTISGAGNVAGGARGAIDVDFLTTATFNGPIVLAADATVGTNGGTLNLGGTIDKTDKTLTANAYTPSAIINFNGTIFGNADGLFDDDMVFTGGGTHNLNVANTYQGKTFIQYSGTRVNANVVDALPTLFGRSELTMDAGTILNTFAAQSIASLSGTGIVDTMGNTLTMGYGTGVNTGGNATADFSGAIIGAGGLTKDGTNNQALSGANTYTGETNVLGGTLTIAAGGSITSSSGVNVNGGATLGLDAGNNDQLGDGILLLLNADSSSPGSTLTLGGTETIDTLTDNGGSIINGNGVLTAGTVNLNGTTTGIGTGLTVNTGGSFTINSVGTTTLNGNTRSSGFNVNGGTVTLGGNDTTNTATIALHIASGAAFNANGGILNTAFIVLSATAANPDALVFLDSNDTYNGIYGNGTINETGAAFTNLETAVLSPGENTGALRIGQMVTGGNYVENGTLVIDFNPLDSTADNLRVLGGLAMLNPSSVLNPYDFSGGNTAGIGQRFNIIDTGMGGLPGGPVIAGAFGEITDGDNAGPNGVTDQNQLFFDLGTGNLVGLGLIDNEGPDTYGGTANQTAILTILTDTATDDAGNYNSADAGAGTTLDNVYGGPAPGGPISAAQLLANLDALSPVGYAGVLDYTLHATRNYVRNATRTGAPAQGGSVSRMPVGYSSTVPSAPMAESMGMDVFAGFSYLDVRMDTSSAGKDYRLKSAGGYAGLHMAPSDAFQIGAFLAVDDGSVDATGLRLDTEGIVFGIFGRYDHGLFYTSVNASIAEYEVSGRRSTLGGSVNVPDHDADAYQVGIEAGYTVYDTAEFRITPKIGLQYISAD
ncbi:MAG TPA: autotransporter-associated beta strand repeat-containing protein, partial [Verrucomicrobiae bacterium]|nr:autotransporter-associated beta strand repeat-containing protein [Verrucomicrobiae bacterium]